MLAELIAKDLYRTRKAISQRDGVYSYYNNQRYLAFCSNDYLGLSQDHRVITAFKKGAEQYGVGSGASAMISGYTNIHHELELHFADFLRRDKAILFNNGYMANLGIMRVLIGKQDEIFQDKLNHASLLDAAKLTGSKLKRYRHLNMTQLRILIGKSAAKNKLIVAEGVYSMEGDISPLPELVDIAKQHDALLMIDDAHGIGVLGKNGGGTLEHFSLTQKDVPIVVCPLGKAFGGSGAIVAGDSAAIETITQLARTYTYTTNIMPAMACALLTSLQIIKEEPWHRHKLKENIHYFNNGARQRQLPNLNSETAIQTLIVGDTKIACQLSEKLMERGVLIFSIRPPSVPQNSSRLRITLSCLHEKEHIDYLLDLLRDVYQHACADLR